MEQAVRTQVKLLLERDLIGLEGFWQHDDAPCSRQLTIPVDKTGLDVWHQVSDMLQVPFQHMALFFLHRRKTKQRRFTFLSPQSSLRSCISVNASTNSGGDSHLVVLCMLSNCYDPFTLKRCPSRGDEHVHQLLKWSDNLVMLIVKYFCPRTQRVVTLGCNYCHESATPEDMLDKALYGERKPSWLEQRIKPFVERKVVASLRDGMGFTCWEEFRHDDPQDLLKRNIKNTMESEGLYTGDVVIWEPDGGLQSLMQHGRPDVPDARVALTNFSELFAREVPHGTVTFAVAGREVDADRFLLAARSEYFEKMFRPGMAEAATTRVQIPDASFEGFTAVLRYIYAAGAVSPEFWAEADPLEILHLSVEFMLEDLTRLCESRLAREDMDVDTALGRLRSILPLRAKIPELAEACIGVLKGRMDAVPASAVAELCKFPDTMRELLVALDEPDSKRRRTTDSSMSQIPSAADSKRPR